MVGEQGNLYPRIEISLVHELGGLKNKMKELRVLRLCERPFYKRHATNLAGNS